MAARAVGHSVQAQAMGMTHQAAVQRGLTSAAHGVPAQRAAGTARQAWPSAHVVPGRPTVQRV